MGYRTFVPAETAEPQDDLQSDAAAGVIENEFLKVTLDSERDAIRSVVDKRTGRELVDLDSGYALGQYLYERFDANQVAAYVRAYVKNRLGLGPWPSWANPRCRLPARFLTGPHRLATTSPCT